MPLQHTIGGVDWTMNILRKTIRISEERNETPNTASFIATALASGSIPLVGQEVVLIDAIGSASERVAFKGYILSVERQSFTRDDPYPRYACSCVDYTWELDWHRIDRTTYAKFVPVSATDIVTGLIAEFAPTIGDDFVEAGLEDIVEFSVEHGELPSSALNRIAQMIGAQWYVDYNKTLHFFVTPETSVNLPSLTATNQEVLSFKSTTDLSQMRSRTKVFGATSALTDTIEADDTQIPVADTTPFSASGGRAVVRNSEIAYTGKSVDSGPGYLTGIPTGSPVDSVLSEAYPGDPVQVLAIEEDAGAALDLGDRLVGGSPSTPVYIEHAIVDETLNDQKAHLAALTDLNQNKTPEPTIVYKTRNPHATAGKTVSVDFTDARTGEHVVGDFQIQTVDIEDEGLADNRFTRTVSAFRTKQNFFAMLNVGGSTIGGGGTGSSSGGGAGGGGGGGRLIGYQTITATGSGTLAPRAGTRFVIVELQAAGGGGSGVSSPGAGNVNLGGGGQGGGWLRVRLDANFDGASYSVGAKGTGGTAGNNQGSDGGDTTFTIVGGGTTYTAKGGVKGNAQLGPFAPPFQFNPPAGNSTTGGDHRLQGGSPSHGQTLGLANGNAQSGGAGMYSRGSLGPGLTGTNQSTAGFSAPDNGGGGSGAIATGTGVAQAGGDGSDGLIIVWEYA